MKFKLIHKLLIAMFACAALVLVLFTLVTRASIGSGFMEFLQLQERNQVSRLVPELTDWYSQHGNWDEMSDNPREFFDLVFVNLLQENETGPEFGEGRGPSARNGRRGPRYPGSGQGPGPAGPNGGPLRRNGLPQRVFLLDSEQLHVIGNLPEKIDQDKLLPIRVNGVNVGWLGVTAISSFKLPEEEAFIRQLGNNLLIGLGLGLIVAGLLAWLLARHLSRPINAVASGVRALAAGDFNVRLDTTGSDEIAGLADDVNRLSASLSEHESARKRWMSDIAHELRTPLAIISGELEAMSDGVRPMNREQLGSVREEVTHLAVLVDDLHKLTLTDSGALAYKMRVVDLNELVQLTVDSFQGQVANKGLKLSYTTPERNTYIQGDDQRLRQLLGNLLDNAVRYTDAGGQISIELNSDKQFALLTISDTAPGASIEECERLFERLYRVEGSRNRHSGGSGLGLAICRNIVEAHGGQILATPGPDGGVLITTRLPLRK